MSDTTAVFYETKLSEAFGNAIDRLGSFEEETEDYSKTLTQVERLCKITKSLQPELPAPVEEKKRDRSRIEPWIPVIGSLAGILVVGIMEITGHSMASKAAGFINKIK